MHEKKEWKVPNITSKDQTMCESTVAYEKGPTYAWMHVNAPIIHENAP